MNDYNLIDNNIINSVYLLQFDSINIILHCIGKKKRNFYFRIFKITDFNSIELDSLLNGKEDFIDYFQIESSLRRKIVFKIGNHICSNIEIPNNILKKDKIGYNFLDVHILNKITLKKLIKNISNNERKNANNDLLNQEFYLDSLEPEFDFETWENDMLNKLNF